MRPLNPPRGVLGPFGPKVGNGVEMISQGLPAPGSKKLKTLSKKVFCPLKPKRGRFDENGENDKFAFYPLKTRASLLRPPKTTKMTKMAGVTQAKAWFRKSRACSSLVSSEK